jgi:hypothetical protein
MVDRKVVSFDEFYYQLKLTHVFQKHPVLLFSESKSLLEFLKKRMYSRLKIFFLTV